MNREYKTKLVFDHLEDDFDALDSHIIHGGEGLKHHIVKMAVAYLISQQGRDVGVEVSLSDSGVVDVLDLSKSDEPALAIEIETDCTPQRKQEKREQYECDLIRDVVVIDPTDCPDDLGRLESHLRDELPAV